MGSLIFGAMRRKKVEEEKRVSMLTNSVKQNLSGSGELIPRDEADTVSSDTSVSNLSIFDPPIEQYKFNYYLTSMNHSSVDSTGQPSG